MSSGQTLQHKNTLSIKIVGNLTILRDELSLSNREIARHIGKSEGFVSNVFTGKKRGSLSFLRSTEMLIHLHRIRTAVERGEQAAALREQADQLEQPSELILHDKSPKPKPSSTLSGALAEEVKKNVEAFAASVDRSVAAAESERKPGAGEKSGHKEKQTEASSHPTKAQHKGRSAKGNQT